MEMEKIMRSKIILFTKIHYFFNFKNILLKLAYDIYLKKHQHHYLLSDGIDKYKNYFTSSKWFYLMKLMFSKIYIPDFSDINDFEDRIHDNNRPTLKTYEIDKLQYFYLKNICMKKLKKIQYLSFKLKVSLNNIIEIYFDLCIREMFLQHNKKDKHFFKNLSKTNEKDFYNYKKNILTTKTSFSRFKIRKHTKKNSLITLNSIKRDNSISIKNKKKEADEITNIIANKNNTIDILGKRSQSTRPKLLYCNSFTRLFIGETDKDSIIRRHLSNILVLKHNKINVNGIYVDLSKGYLKKLFQNLYQKNKRELLIDNYLQKTYQKYENNQKYLDEYNKKNVDNTPKKGFFISNDHFHNEIDIPFDDNVNIEEQLLKTYHYNKDKNKHKKLRKTKSTNVKKYFILNNKKNAIKKDKENDSSILIENLCKELSDYNHISNVKNKKTMPKNLWIKTENNILQNYNYFNTVKRVNYSHHHNNNFRTNTLKNSNCLKKKILKFELY
jgi:hypothetical protein